MADCKLCEYKGYCSPVCMLHRRHANISSKKEMKKERMLANMDKTKATKLLEREKKKELFEGTGLAAMTGAALGYCGGQGSVLLMGGVVAAHVVAAPLVLGATLAGTGIAVAMNLKKFTRKNDEREAARAAKNKSKNKSKSSQKLLSVFSEHLDNDHY